jgi:hypothetical protein
MQWLGQASNFLSFIATGRISFFARYVLAGTLLGVGYVVASRLNSSLKLVSDHP